jgi:hypothetical protein
LRLISWKHAAHRSRAADTLNFILTIFCHGR